MDGWSESFNDFIGFIAILVLMGLFWGSFKANMDKKNITPSNSDQTNVEQAPVQNQMYYQQMPAQNIAPSPIISSQYIRN